MKTIQQDATMYVDGDLISPTLGLKAETQCIAILAAYCGRLNIELILVTTNERDHLPNMSQNCDMIRIPDSCFNSVSAKCFSDIPPAIQDCNLPAVCTTDQINIYSGLCTVLRYIVNRSSHFTQSQEETSDVISLLGHRMYCLKACSEVSPRTKLCEVLMPSFINNWRPELAENSISGPIVLFENLMSQDVAIHNMDKRQRVLMRRIKGSRVCEKNGGRRCYQKQVVWTKDLPALEHAFAEGIDLSLTDICLFPCIHFCLVHSNVSLSLMEKFIPLTLKWYNRVSGIAKLKKAVSLCGLSFIDMKDNNKLNSSIDSTQILQLKSPPASKALSSKEEKAKKKEILLTIRRDLPALLQKLTSNEIAVKFSKFELNEIAIDWSSLPKEIHPTEGELTELRAKRKCHQIENLVKAVKNVARTGDRIVDFCSGGGHVGIVLAYLFPKCEVILVENKEESLRRARNRIALLNLSNIKVYQCNLEFYRGSFNIGIALHACGVATDMVIQKCMSQNASFVVSPCCYGKVCDTHWITYPQSEHFKSIPISYDENLLLGHAADQTTWNFDSDKAKQGKLCMGYVDLDRANAASERGFKVTLYSMEPHTCSPKNNLLVGEAPENTNI